MTGSVITPPATQVPPAVQPEAVRCFSVLDKSAPQVPVTVEVGGNKFTSHPGRLLNPEAAVFKPSSPFATVDEDDLLTTDVLETLLAGVDDRDDAAVDPPPTPPPCDCHELPKGSCPGFIERFLDLVAEVRNSGVPNMDGVRREIPAEDRQINPEVWALGCPVGQLF